MVSLDEGLDRLSTILVRCGVEVIGRGLSGKHGQSLIMQWMEEPQDRMFDDPSMYSIESQSSYILSSPLCNSNGDP